MKRDKLANGSGGTRSPFALPAMADEYPLDPSERRAVDELLEQFERERTNGEANASSVDIESR
jgi:hypothetical protein